MNAPAPSTTHPWRTEFRATMALAWPLILANLTMAAIQATDVVLMGWLGPRPLAASALGLNLTFALTLIALGLVTASSPMMATALGAQDHARCATCAAPSASRCGWWRPWWCRSGWSCGSPNRSSSALGQEPALARDAADLPARLYVVGAAVPRLSGDAQLRLGAGAARLGAGDQPGRDRAQCAARLRADLRPLGPARDGHLRRRAGQLDRLGACWPSCSRSSSSPTASSAASTCSATGGGPTGRATADCGCSGCRSGWRWGSKAGCSAPPPT